MRILVCGSRNWRRRTIIRALISGLAHEYAPVTVIEGGADGADAIAGDCAEALELGHERYPASWGEHGRAAGPIRNQRMLTRGRPDIVVAFTDDLFRSRGTKDMVNRACAAGVSTYLVSRVSA